MKLKLLPAIFAAGFLSAPFALAASYQSEVSASYTDIDVSDDPEEGYFVSIEGKYYFSPVDTASHPLAEAAFVEKASNIYLGVANEEYKEAGERMDAYMRTLGVDFYIPNTMFYLGAGVIEAKYKYSWLADENVNAGGNSSKWNSAWYAKAGIAPVTGLLLWSEFFENVDVSDQWNINGKYVMPLSGEQALNLEASYQQSDIDDADTISGAVDYYLDRHLSIGAGFENTSYADDHDSTTDYFVRARNFFTDTISAEVSYTDNDIESLVTLGASIRF